MTTLASNQDGCEGIVVDGGVAYWTNYGGGTIAEVPIDGGTPTTIATGQDGPGNLAVTASGVYWVNSAPTGSVMRFTPTCACE